MKGNGTKVTLYHATNLASAKRAVETGLGLDRRFYVDLISSIALEMGADADTVLFRMREHLGASEIGSVSLAGWDFAQVMEHYGSFGGETKGHIIEEAFKKAARLTGVKYLSPGVKKLKAKVDRKVGGVHTSPTIVEVQISKSRLAYYSQTGGESYTKGIIPPKCITAILGFAATREKARVYWESSDSYREVWRQD